MTLRKLSAILFALGAWAGTSTAQVVPVPPILQGYVETALSQNPDILAAREHWKQADARVDQANSNLYPKIDFTGRYTHIEGGRIFNFPGLGSFSTSKLAVPLWDNKFEAIWPIFNYAVWQGTKASKAYLNAATAEVQARELAIEYAVADAYYTYAKAAELVTIRDKAIELARQNLATAEALYKVDKAPKNDLLRAEVAVASSQGELLVARNMQNVAKTNFNNLLKRDYDAEIQLMTPMELQELTRRYDVASSDVTPTPTTSFTSDLSQAYEARPEITQITNAAMALEGLRAVNYADYIPNVALFGSYGWQEDKLQFSGNGDTFIGGVQLKWNLFSGFGTMAKVAETQAQIAELEFNREAAMSGIRIELQNARLERENARDRRQIALKQLQSAEENRRITKAQYEAGLVPLITMIDAETTLSNSKANLAVTTYDVLTAEAKYRKALGER